MRLFAKSEPCSSEEYRRLLLAKAELCDRMMRELCEVRPEQIEVERELYPAVRTKDGREICLN